MADLQLSGINKRFGDVQAVSDLSLDIQSGEFIVLLGPSGAGKTTTLRLVAGLETPEAGAIHIGGREVTALAPALRDVTFVFQQYSLYPHLSVFDNLAFPLRSPLRPVAEPEIKRKVLEVARMLRIEDKLQNPATRLSGGQMQRVAIGRAILSNPRLLALDEPLAALDEARKAEISQDAAAADGWGCESGMSVRRFWKCHVGKGIGFGNESGSHAEPLVFQAGPIRRIPVDQSRRRISDKEKSLSGIRSTFDHGESGFQPKNAFTRLVR